MKIKEICMWLDGGSITIIFDNGTALTIDRGLGTTTYNAIYSGGPTLENTEFILTGDDLVRAKETIKEGLLTYTGDNDYAIAELKKIVNG